MPMARAQNLSLGMVGLFGLLSLPPHMLIWGMPRLPTSPSVFLLFGALLVIGVVVHEAIHGLGFAWGGADWSAIEFGFSWTGLAPYAHCTTPLRCGAYRWAIALPGVVLGVIPLAVGLAVGHGGTTVFAFIMLASASGDALLLWTLRAVPRASWVQDHPSKMGALVLGHSSSEVAPILSFELEAASPGDREMSREQSFRLLLILIVVSAIIGGVVGFLAAGV